MSANQSETGRHDWIDAPDTKGRTAALRGVLAAICLITAILLVAASLPAPSDQQDIALVLGSL
jgi:hypothetical protein